MSNLSIIEDAVNAFILHKYGIKNAWTYKHKPRCALKSTSMLGILKRFQDFARVFYLNEITYSNLEVFINSVRYGEKQVGNGTINKHISRFRGFLGHCIKHSWLRSNEAEKLETLKVSTPIRYHFSEEDIALIFKNASPRFLPFFELMLETGLRACDMWNLTQDN